MYNARRDVLQDGQVHKFRIVREGEQISYATALEHWQRDASFRSLFLSLLREVPFSAYRWETPPVTSDTAEQVFEFAIVNDPGLARPPDRRPFEEHFTDADAGEGIVVFENLGGDATLVVPSPRGSDDTYGHLATFSRQAPASQNHALWQTVGKTMEQHIGDQPRWLSTAGGGVAWLHVRLDERPKYYKYRPYANAA